VLLSAPGRPDIDNSTERLAAMLAEKKAPQAEIDRAIALLRKVSANPDATDIRSGVRELTLTMAGGMVPADQVDALVDNQLASMRSPWGRFWTTFDPGTVMGKVKCPVLAISGSLDRALPTEKNLQQIHQSLRQAGRSDVTVLELFGVNHLLQTASTGAMTEFAETEETISPRALALVSGWLRDHAERRRREP
jgi:pimeloyl-ACP methyl ester carboxylesterase